MGDLVARVERICELQVRRRFYISVMNKQTNAGKALVRRALGFNTTDDEASREADSNRASRIVSAALSGKPQKEDDIRVFQVVAFDIAVIAEGLRPYQCARHQIELQMCREARELPVAEWQRATYGLGELGLATIVGEAGLVSCDKNLPPENGNYPNPGKLWKRLGLAPHEGKCYSTWRMKAKKEGKLSKDEWIQAGYSPKRRAAIFASVGSPLIGGMGNGPRPLVDEDIDDREDWSPYQREFVRRLRHEAARDPSKRLPDKDGKESYTRYAKFLAQHKVEKDLIRDLWVEWRRVTLGLAPEPYVQDSVAGDDPAGREAKVSVKPLDHLPHATPSADEAERSASFGLKTTSSVPSAPISKAA